MAKQVLAQNLKREWQSALNQWLSQSPQIRMAKDGWTALAVDGLPSAHFEHTILVDDELPEIITIPEGFGSADDYFEQKLSFTTT